mmetsp:Transcript_30149/g.82867  ORF Transcript_30149/g.82867 Transcript_30149/m.82867 type:complete len:234 (-) Transcript_30149:64-765(-)
MTSREEAFVEARVWVGGLPSLITDEKVEELFSTVGKVKWVKIRGSSLDTFGFVQYYRVEDALEAVRRLDQSPALRNVGNCGKGGVIKVAAAHLLPTKGKGKAKGKVDERKGKFRPDHSRSPSSRKRRRSPSRSMSSKKLRSESRDLFFKLTPTVRLENLPEDMDDEELESLARDFGPVAHVKTWNYRGVRHGRLEYEHMEDAVEAVCQLDDRRVDGWAGKLGVYMPCSSLPPR